MNIITEYELNEKGIDAASAAIDDFLSAQNVDSKEALRVRLGIEEILLRYKGRAEIGKTFDLKLSKKFGAVSVKVYVEGQMYDPLVKKDSAEENSSFMRAALSNMGELPIWRYSNGENVISYSLNKKYIASWKQLIGAIVLAIGIGFMLKIAPENVTNFVHGSVISPILDTFLNILSTIAGPMIFLAVVWGIYSIGDVSAFSVLGKKLLTRLIVFVSAITIVFGLVMLPLFSIATGQAEMGNGFTDIFQMILNIAPQNIIAPFADGNTLQILFVGIVMGIAMILLGEKTQTVAIFAEQLNYIVQIIMKFISRLVPFFVFLSVIDIFLNDDVVGMGFSYKLFIINAIACFVLVIIYFLIVRIKLRVSPGVLLKKALKTFIISFTTASSAAAFSTNLETCKNEYGLDESITNFGIPFAQVVYKPSVALLYFTSAAYAAEAFGVSISISWIISLFIMSIILSVATPPIPGGALASITVLFAQLNLPTEGIAVVLAINMIIDFFETPTDVFGGQAVLMLAANRFGLIDKNVLRSQKTDK